LWESRIASRGDDAVPAFGTSGSLEGPGTKQIRSKEMKRTHEYGATRLAIVASIVALDAAMNGATE
jgi:hypothetical protein